MAKLLLRSDPSWAGFELDDGADVLEAYGVRRKPGTLRCAGAGALQVNGRTYELADFAPTASLPEAWGDAWCDAAAAAGVACITTIENECRFFSNTLPVLHGASSTVGLTSPACRHRRRTHHRRRIHHRRHGAAVSWLPRIHSPPQRGSGPDRLL